SFDGLIEDMYGDKYLVDRASEGLAIRKRQLFVQNDKLQAEIVGDANNLNNIYAFYDSHDERFMVYDDQDSYELVETNGKIVKTARNTLIVWPAEMKEIYWKERLIMDKEDEEDIAVFYKNMPKMVEMFKEYQSKNKSE
ncbi:MAG: hypothetical protein ACE5I1_21300, partial [bacterium]